MDGDEKVRLAVLETKLEQMEKDMSKIQNNHRWGVLAVLGVVMKSIMDQIGLSQ